ncbi:MAG: sensor histidine kinase [Gemmatimonas sp.]|nr:sensor histidine kinase [Gemmatimonas sp.]
MPRWQPQAQQLGVTLVVESLEETPVQGDALLLSRLCGVLLDNAFRYGAAAGTVRLSVRALHGRAVLTVEDDGPGVPPDDRGRVFDRFYRGETARHKRADGSGLGLAIAAWIVRRHGGTITVHDSALGGAEFRVGMPLALAWKNGCWSGGPPATALALRGKNARAQGKARCRPRQTQPQFPVDQTALSPLSLRSSP